MILLNKYQEKKKELFSLTPTKLQKAPERLSNLYESQLQKWVDNALQFEKDYPVKVAKYFAELFNSDFTLKFIFESQKKFDLAKDNQSLQDKVVFI